MKYFYKGMVYEVVSVYFDLVGQSYCAHCKQVRVLNYWRRDSHNIGIGSTDVWIYISPDTPHIKKLENEGLDSNGICANIASGIVSYIDYADNNRKPEWVSYSANKEDIIVDRITQDEIAKHLGISESDKTHITIYNAY